MFVSVCAIISLGPVFLLPFRFSPASAQVTLDSTKPRYRRWKHAIMFNCGIMKKRTHTHTHTRTWRCFQKRAPLQCPMALSLAQLTELAEQRSLANCTVSCGISVLVTWQGRRGNNFLKVSVAAEHEVKNRVEELARCHPHTAHCKAASNN